MRILARIDGWEKEIEVNAHPNDGILEVAFFLPPSLVSCSSAPTRKELSSSVFRLLHTGKYKYNLPIYEFRS